MQPLMVTNLGAIPRYAPYRPAARPMPYAPAPVRPRQVLAGTKPRHQLGVFTIEELPSSAIIAGASVGAFYFSGLLPTPWDMVVKGVSAAGVGYALYRLFSPPGPEAAGKSGGAQVAPPSPIARAEDFSLINGIFLTPKNYSTLSYSFFTGTYPVELLVSYPFADNEIAKAQQKPVTLNVQLEATEKPYYYWGSSGEPITGPAADNQQIVLNPGDQTTLKFNATTLSSTNVFARPSLSVTLTAYKVRVGGSGRDKIATVTFFLK